VLSQKTRYALKALLELASLPAGATLSSAEISARRTIPVKFLESILVELKRDGLVYGRRGRMGGYQLARRAEAISFGAVIRLIEGPLALLPCASVTQFRRCADCHETGACELQTIFRALRDSTSAILDGWTVADALARSRASEGSGGSLSPKRAGGDKPANDASPKRSRGRRKQPRSVKKARLRAIGSPSVKEP
jgi:Rrf2 family protein